MNVSGNKKCFQVQRPFKEDDFCDINNYKPLKKRHSSTVHKPRKLALIRPLSRLSEKLSPVSSDSDSHKKDKGTVLFSTKRCKHLFKKVKNEPNNKEFEFNYEITMHGPFDYLFEFRGSTEKSKFMIVTQKIRNLSKHLKFTLFCNEKIREFRKRDFSVVMTLFDDFRKSGHKHYKARNFQEALDNYLCAYSLCKWIEFKDEKKRYDLLKKSAQEPILDEDIFEDSIKVDDNEEDSFRSSLTYLLLSMSYAFIELRHYKEAIECLNECICITGDCFAEPFFRRCQARLYNRFSDEDQLILALADLQKAKSLKSCEVSEDLLSKSHQTLSQTIEEKKTIELEKIKCKYKNQVDFISNLNFELGRKDLESICRDDWKADNNSLEKRFQILREMKIKYKLAVKYFTETKNSEQLILAYNEIDEFYDIYYLYKYYYLFSVKTMNKQQFSILGEEDRALLLNVETKLLIEKVREGICEHIFYSGKYNSELYKYACEKVGFSTQLEGKKMLPMSDRMRPSKGKVASGKDEVLGSLTMSALLVIVSICLISLHLYWFQQPRVLF